METVAVIGYGDMGQEMVPHLLAAGHEVRVHERNAAKREAAAAAGATVAESAADAVRGATVVLGLVMSDDLPEAFIGDSGALAGTEAGALVLIGSTTTPQMIADLSAAAPDGVRVIDTPIVGGVRYAREKAVTFLVGSDDETDNARISDLLSVLGRIRFVGEFGSGVAYKLITNVAIMAAEAGIREALDLADILGKDYEVALDLMSHGPMAAVVERALDASNPRPLRRSAEDDDTLLSAVSQPETELPISSAGAKRLWEAVVVNPDYEPDFIDLTRTTTSRPTER
ncbi:NAD(P)-binding domain-containing protein [Brevibacterium sp. 2SA]|uniref:NAD(P)-dependent oxidoreductase n=1 Tax=Brevibacterium sp. 2SA TaxID=2502198 RepID=UPI0010F7CA5E|nr:NAD(P)-binding domain-containing protein [Brevibacterium sp. 2SA]